MKPVVKIILGIIVVLAVAGGSFYGGNVYGKSQATANAAAFRRGAAGQFSQGGQTTTNQGNSMLFGTVKTVNADGLVVTDNSGNEITVKVAGTTLISKNMSVKVTDLTEGETVIISGRKADDGSITARSLQVAPAGRFSAEGGPQQMPQAGQGQDGLQQGGFPPGGPEGGFPPAP